MSEFKFKYYTVRMYFFPYNTTFCDILDKLHLQAFLYGYWPPERGFIKVVASLD